MIRKSVAQILDQHVTFELEAIDRMYLNGYVPSLQTGGGVVYFMKQHLGVRVPSTLAVAPLTKRFIEAIEGFVTTTGVDLVTFEKDQRKDDVAQTYLGAFTADGASSLLGRRRRRPGSSGRRNGATPTTARRIPGSFARRFRSTTTTFTCSIAASGRCSSSSARTSPTR
jgi:hypothetical protein